jgi:tetratricopeptide (TPR) repeat protein
LPDFSRIDDLRRRVQKDPASIAFAQLAEECRRAGQNQEAVDVCRAGLALHPGYLSARVTLGRALIELNELEGALNELLLVLKSAPENLAAIRGLAEIFQRQGLLTEALAQYRAALALARNDPDLQHTVEELARKIEPPLPPASADGLSFEQIQDEFLKHLPPPPRPPKAAAAPQIAPAPPLPEPASTTPDEPSSAGTESAPQAGLDVERLAAPAESTAEIAAAAREATPEIEAAPPDYTSISEIEAAAAEAAPEIDAAPPDFTASNQELAAHQPALQIIAALEQWLDAIHVTRADRRA